MKTPSSDFLDSIPDFQAMEFNTLSCWIDEQITLAQNIQPSADVMNRFSCIELTQDFSGDFGPEASPLWRKFFLAVLVADWACYPKQSDRADFSRLRYIMSSAYKYTRLWGVTLADGSWVPVGYSAWYPIARFVYEGVLQSPQDVDDRGVFMPLRFVQRNEITHAYVLNASIVPSLQNTTGSLRLLRALCRDNASLKHAKVMTLTVSEDGNKLSRIARFTKKGRVQVLGETEYLFVRDPQD